MKNEVEGIPITAEQAAKCLNIKPDNRIHSFTMGFCISGADLDLPRVKEILEGAATENRLCLSNELGGAMRHDIAAWDNKYQQWLYLECEPVKLEQLKRSLR